MISMKPTDWNIRFSPGMPKHPQAYGPVVQRSDTLSGWQFDFPFSLHSVSNKRAKLKSVNYVTTSKFDKLHLGQVLRATFHIVMSPDVYFEYGAGPNNPCPRAANYRLYLQKGKSLSDNANTRWWSNPISQDLISAGEEVLLAVPLEPDNWSNIWGHMGDEDNETIKGFFDAVAKAGAVGGTFGGGCFFGHGAGVSKGSAQFIMTEYRVD